MFKIDGLRVFFQGKSGNRFEELKKIKAFNIYCGEGDGCKVELTFSALDELGIPLKNEYGKEIVYTKIFPLIDAKINNREMEIVLSLGN